MSVRAKLVRPGDASWTEALAATEHDFYHLPAYVQLEAARMDGEAAAVLAEGDGCAALLPLITRELPAWEGVPAGTVDAVTPYGYSGLVATPGVSDQWMTRALEPLVAVLRDQGVCSVFARQHPLFPGVDRALAAAGLGTFVEHGETVWIDLEQARDEIWRQTRSSDRNRINKMHRLGYRAWIDEDWNAWPEFLRIYADTMRRLDAADWYYFSESYFGGLRAALGDERLKLCVVEADGQIVSAGLFSEYRGVVQFHLSGTASEWMRRSPARLMVDHVRWWAKERGNTAFHLGGGLGGAGGALLEFKAGLSKLRTTFRTWRLIVDPTAYRAAEEAWEREAGEAVPGGYFPSYRAPVVRLHE